MYVQGGCCQTVLIPLTMLTTSKRAMLRLGGSAYEQSSSTRQMTTITKLLACGSVLAIGLLVAFTVVVPSPGSPPVALSLLGYTNEATGSMVAILRMSNQSSGPVTYSGDGPFLPHYSLMRTMVRTTKVLTSTNLHWDYSIRATSPTLPSGAYVDFPVPLPAVYTDLLVRVSYFPQRGPISRTLHTVHQMCLSKSEEHFDSVTLRVR
jgi:hypothetical protein